MEKSWNIGTVEEELVLRRAFNKAVPEEHAAGSAVALFSRPFHETTRMYIDYVSVDFHSGSCPTNSSSLIMLSTICCIH